MTEKKKPELTEAEILKVKEKAAEMLGVCKKQNDIIKNPNSLETY